jgi:hypothetical protein
MKIFELLNEGPDDIAAVINRDCKPFLDAVNKPVYRGLYPAQSRLSREIETGAYIVGVRNDRRSKDSSDWLHDALNGMFTKAVGVPLRSASVFCSTSKIVAADYGIVHAMFPIGEWHYAWSPLVADAFSVFEDGSFSNRAFTKLVEKTIETLDFRYPQADDGEEDGWVEFRDLKWEQQVKVMEYIIEHHGAEIYKFDEGLAQALSTGNEMMVVCDKYYALDEGMHRGLIKKLINRAQ